MLGMRAVARERLEKATSSLYMRDVNLRSMLLREGVAMEGIARLRTLTEEERQTQQREHPTFAQAKEAFDAGGTRVRDVTLGESFGPSWSTHWFEVQCVLPPQAAVPEDAMVLLRWNSNAEVLVHDAGGALVQGLNGGDGHDRRVDVHLELSPDIEEEMTLLFYLEMSCNGAFGVGDGGMIFPPDPHRTFCLQEACIVVQPREAYDLYWDFVTLRDMAKCLADDGGGAQSHVGHRCEFVAGRILDVMSHGDHGRSNEDAGVALAGKIARARALAATVLSSEATGPATEGARVEIEGDAADGDVETADTDDADGRLGQFVVHAVGHCHIDAAWLWPYRETKRKVARSFANALAVMEHSDRFTFCASHSVFYKWTEELYPHLHARVLDAVRAGKFHPVGGTFVEFDANLPSGEAMARQFLHGQADYVRLFGARAQEFWLPDTFGYSGQLPQLICQSQMRFFLTQKLSWNLINKFPHNTFHWEGIDGSRILTHFPPADTYESDARVEHVLKSMTNYKNKDRYDCAMLLYGHGDGGGGPTPEHVDKLARLQNTPGVPRVRFSSPHEFVCSLEAQVARRAPEVWRGELYFELHQGTFTSQALVKKRNRQCQQMFHDLEFLLVAKSLGLLPQLHPDSGSSFGADGGEAAAEQQPPQQAEAKAMVTPEWLRTQWEPVLLNQFHDVLPGTSIEDVFHDVHTMYNEVVGNLQRATAALLSHSSGPPSRSSSHAVGVVNTVGIDRHDLVLEIPHSAATTAAGSDSPPHVEGRQWTVPRAAHMQFSATAEQAHTETKEDETSAHAVAWQNAPDRADPAEVEGQRVLLARVDTLPAYSVARVELQDETAGAGVAATRASGSVTVTEVLGVGEDADAQTAWVILENDMVRVSLNCDGTIRSLVDKRVQPEREVVQDGARAADYRLHEDLPFYWDAWDVMPYHLKTGKAVMEGARVLVREVRESGPLRAMVAVELGPIGPGGSVLRQTIALSATSARIDFNVAVRWRENRKFLRVDFPWSVRSDTATYEIQFGQVQRPTHTNTSWDAAKWEVCAQKYADLSEPGYGVAILNDCKHGYSCRDSTMSLSLLRAPKAPDGTCDMGEHTFSFAVLPHLGSSHETLAALPREALHFNAPPLISAAPPPRDAGGACGSSVVRVDPPACTLLLDTVKPLHCASAASMASAASTSFIVRLYETVGARGIAQLRCARRIQQCFRCNLLEDEEASLAIETDASNDTDTGTVSFPFKPFEIVTLKLVVVE